MITLKEFQDLVQILKDNEQRPDDQKVDWYNGWHLSKRDRFIMVDDDENSFEIKDSNLTYLGKSVDALEGLIKMARPLGPPDLARRFNSYVSEALTDVLTP
jgi:hypothetical protein